MSRIKCAVCDIDVTKMSVTEILDHYNNKHPDAIPTLFLNFITDLLQALAVKEISEALTKEEPK